MDAGYVHIFSMNVLLQLLGFCSVLLVANFLLPSDLGMLKTAQAYAAVAVVIGGFGMNAPLLRFCSDSRFDEKALQNMLSTAIRAVVWVSLVLVVVILVVVFFVLGFDTQVGRVYALYSLVLPALSLTGLLYVYMQSRQQFVALAKNQSLIKLASVCFVVCGTYVFGLYGFLIANVTVSYLGLLPLLRLTGARWRSFTAIKNLEPDFYRFAIYGMLSMFISVLGQSSDFILMDFVGTDSDDIGRYALASVFFLGAATLTGSIQAVVTPKFTALLASPSQFLAYMRGWIPKITILSFAVACMVIFLGWVLQTWFFGEKYVGYIEYLAILMVKYVIWSSYALVGSAMAGAGLFKSGVLVALAMTSLSFAVGYPLCKWWGAYGAAMAQVGISVLNLGLIWWLQRWEFERLFRVTLK